MVDGDLGWLTNGLDGCVSLYINSHSVQGT